MSPAPAAVRATADASIRTERAVLAVNGFAADGNMFVKKVKQRLEVRLSSRRQRFTAV